VAAPANLSSSGSLSVRFATCFSATVVVGVGPRRLGMSGNAERGGFDSFLECLLVQSSMGRYFELFLSRWGSRILLFASPLFALFLVALLRRRCRGSMRRRRKAGATRRRNEVARRSYLSRAQF